MAANEQHEYLTPYHECEENYAWLLQFLILHMWFLYTAVLSIGVEHAATSPHIATCMCNTDEAAAYHLLHGDEDSLWTQHHGSLDHGSHGSG
jgi:hypothetical protein